MTTPEEKAGERLLPCPFCGFATRLFKEYDNEHVRLYCEACGATAGQFLKTREDAIRLWNRRTPSAENGEEISPCSVCNSMTHTVRNGKCGKCGASKPNAKPTAQEDERTICIEGRSHVWGPDSDNCLQCGLHRTAFDAAQEDEGESVEEHELKYGYDPVYRHHKGALKLHAQIASLQTALAEKGRQLIDADITIRAMDRRIKDLMEGKK